MGNTTPASRLKEKRALELYLNTDMSQNEICELVGWTPQTFTAHKKTKGWDKLRSAHQLTAASIIKKLYAKMDELAGAERIDADKLAKLAATIEKISDKKVTISSVINAFRDFTEWLHPLNPDLAKIINQQQKAFIHHLMNKQ